MKIWMLQVPVGGGFAELMELDQDPESLECDACRWSRPAEPLAAEWDEGSDRIGDFTFAGARIVCKKTVVDELRQRFGGIREGLVEFPDHPNLRRPSRVTKRTPRRVWLPYEGPPLVELIPTVEVPLLPESTALIESRCDECGRVVYASFEGIERKNSRQHVPREAGMGLFFRRSDLRGVNFFRPHSTFLTLCSDGAKQHIRTKRYANIELLEVGDAR